MADAKITALTADTAPTTDDLIVTVNDPGGTPANRKSTIGQVLIPSNMYNGVLVNAAYTVTTALASGTTTIPLDDTIPQKTEGDEYMTCTITPKATTNTLIIMAHVQLSHDEVGGNMVAALFQDTANDALAIDWVNNTAAYALQNLDVHHAMVAGTTSAITFKIRAGNAATAGTTRFNGNGAARYFGAITHSSMFILEYKS